MESKPHSRSHGGETEQYKSQASSHSPASGKDKDATREAEIQKAAEAVAMEHGQLFINLGTILHPAPEEKQAFRRFWQRWASVSVCGSIYEDLSITLARNTIGPLVIAKYFAPLLLKGSGAFGHQFADLVKQHKAILVNPTAKVGSIGDNVLGGWYSYRMSKAALNMATKNLSIELRRGKTKVMCISLHPGTVNTDIKVLSQECPQGQMIHPEMFHYFSNELY